MAEEPEDVRFPGEKEMDAMISDIRSLISDKKEARLIQRLLFIRGRMLGYGLEELCEILFMSPAAGYRIQEAWAEGGVEAISPHFEGGRRCLLTTEQLEELADEADRLKMTTAEAREFIRRRFGVEYSTKQVDHHLRAQGLSHRRPYDIDFGSEEEAERVMSESSVMRWTRRFYLIR